MKKLPIGAGTEAIFSMDIEKYMTPRLLAVANFAKKGSKVADVGTDHAYIPIWLVTRGVSDFAVAMDINKGPLLRAKENITKFNLEDKITTKLSDGLEGLEKDEADTVIIAGMGGVLINRILDDAKALYPSIKHFILQPMTAIEETRKFLSENGFLIENECLAKEDDKIYTVLSVIRGKMKIEDEVNLYIGKPLIENRDPLLKDLLSGRIYELNKAISLMEKTDNESVQNRRNYFTCLRDKMEKIKEACQKW